MPTAYPLGQPRPGLQPNGIESDALISREETTPRALRAIHQPPQSSSSIDGDEDDVEEEDDDADFQSHYSLNATSSSGASSSSDSENHSPYQHSNASFISNAFAPPFYNRPPTPLPPSPSLTSLLRPSFSTANSRPTTPDSSEGDTPNDTEEAVARSARTATTVPRASPKVPTYEYHGFVMYLLSALAFRRSPYRLFLPSPLLFLLSLPLDLSSSLSLFSIVQ